MIYSNGTGGGNFAAGSTWAGGVVPAADNWTILAGDVVTVSATAAMHGGTVAAGGQLIISGAITGTFASLDLHGLLLVAAAATLASGDFNHWSDGTLHAADGCVCLVEGNYNWYGGDILLYGSANVGGGGGNFVPQTYNPAERTATLRNPHQIVLSVPNPGSNQYLWYGFGAGGGFTYNSGHFLDLIFDNTPAIPSGIVATAASVDIAPIDLNYVQPGGVVEDYGFGWDAINSNGFPFVWPILNGSVSPVTVSLYCLNDSQWHWTFTLPDGTALGSNLLATTARDDGNGNLFVQQFRAQLQEPWATSDQAAGILAKVNASVNITTENTVIHTDG
jgi:hypothetical protein